MVDQDEIDDRVLSWIRAHKQVYLDDGPAAYYQSWDQFVDQHDAETARAFRESAFFEYFRVLDALSQATAREIKTGTPVDDSIVENVRQGGTPSFTGERARVRYYIEVVRELLVEELMNQRIDE